MRLLNTLLIVTVALALACGGDESSGGDFVDTDTVQPKDTVQTPDITGLQADITGWYYHVDHLYVLEPAGEENVLADTLTSLWNPQIARDQLIIMFYIAEFNRETMEVVLEAGSAMKHANGNYQMLANPPPERIVTRLEGNRLLSSQKAALQVYPDLVTSPIPILNLEFDATLTDDGFAIYEGGLLTGGICVSDAQEINFKLFESATGCTNFYNFITDVGIDPDAKNLPCPKGGSDGFSFRGNFDAHRVENVEPGTISIDRTFECR